MTDIQALKTGKSVVKAKFDNEFCVYSNYTVVAGKEWKSNLALTSGKNKYITANKNILSLYPTNEKVAKVDKTSCSTVKYKITSISKGKADIYVWYEDGTHSRICVTVL